MSVTLPFAADLLVAILLVASIASSLRLSRRMATLKADEGALRATIGELLVATDAAERAVGGLRGALADAEATLRERLRQAENAAAALATEVKAGEAVIGRVSRIRDAVRATADAAGLSPATPAPDPVAESFGATVRAAREIAARSSRRVGERAA